MLSANKYRFNGKGNFRCNLSDSSLSMKQKGEGLHL